MAKLKSISKLNKWFHDLNEPLIIAGPCSAESEAQVMQTAKEIAALGKVKVFRSGIWKPRTRPGNFEGVGEEGLHWLRRILNLDPDAVVILMSIEIMLTAVNIAMVAFSRYGQFITGQGFVIFIMVVAAAEVAVGLALIIAIYRSKKTVDSEKFDLMKW